MNAAHTPGPWSYEVEKVSGPKLSQACIFAHGAVIGVAYGGLDDRGEERGDSQANARLIAAAPDLLEAARETAGDFDPKDIRALAAAALYQASLLGGQKEAIASILQHYARGLRLSRAAIAKATVS